MSPAHNTDLQQPRAPCFHSHPSDLELVECHLRPWVASGRKAAASSFVHEADLYAAAPAELAKTFAPAVAQNGERAWYFLTRLRLKGRRFARTVDKKGAGWWHGEAKERPVVDVLGGWRQVGRRQFFSFMKEERGARVRTGWIMSELRLGSDDHGRCDREEDLRVLCKVYRSPRYPAEPSDREPAVVHGRKGAEEADDDDDGSSTATTAKADGETSGAAAEPAPGRDEEAATETSVAAPERERDDGESSAAPRKRKAADDNESSGASRKRTADGNRSGATGLHCPQCGFHLGAQAGVAPAKFDSETGIAAGPQGGETGDSSVRAHTFYNFF